MVTGRGPTVEVHVETSEEAPDPEHWARVAAETLETEEIRIGRLDLFFVDPPSIQDLNRDHLGHDRPTDVLAFPLDGPAIAAAGGRTPTPTPPGTELVHLGDVVVCPEIARRQAPDHAGSFAAELTLLVVHGVLHVLGHDHAEPEETARMQQREREHLRRHGFAHPVPVPG